MMVVLIDKFASSTYKILKQIYDCRIWFPDKISYIFISQVEIAMILGVSIITMNKYFKQFQEDGVNWIKIGDARLKGNTIASVKQQIKKEGVKN